MIRVTCRNIKYCSSKAGVNNLSGASPELLIRNAWAIGVVAIVDNFTIDMSRSDGDIGIPHISYFTRLTVL